MENSKCTCHINGFEVKDAYARRELDKHYNELGRLEVIATDAQDKGVSCENAITQLNSEMADVQQEIRWINDNPPGGGGAKIYRHTITVNYCGDGTYYQFFFTIYSTESYPFYDFDDINLDVNETIPISGWRDPTDSSIHFQTLYSLQKRNPEQTSNRYLIGYFDCGYDSTSLNYFNFDPPYGPFFEDEATWSSYYFTDTVSEV